MTDSTGLKTADQDAGGRVVSLDGVRYGILDSGGTSWRLGTVNPLWMQHMPTVSRPEDDELAALEKDGIFLSRRDALTPHLAVMCCGQGMVWPGMGRELYDNFPAARDAMDRLAACANWDVLALMDEPDVETIGLTRWQQPYLFLLEFAQWSLYRSLGLKPSLICGHSLGELIALCLAGVYTPEVCWYILETRSNHMADLEAKSTRDTGMLAVYAGEDVLAEVRETWPDLYVSNYNTPKQFILSGPRDILMQARRALRKKHYPAVMLNVTLAFHHPSMRVLRDLSYRRLSALEMHAPSTLLLSCVTTGFYPDDEADICRYIVDLDEHSVRWVECVRNMWQRDGIRHFLELGPQDTLCGLVTENEPRALCMASSARGHECENMRCTLAKLFSLGHLSYDAVRTASAILGKKQFPSAAVESPSEVPCSAEHQESGESSRTEKVTLELLGKASGRDPSEIRLGMDLRFDLSLRSSSFPRLIEEAEKELHVSVDFEDLLQVVTVGDLMRIFAGKTGEKIAGSGLGRPALGAPLRRPFLARTSAAQTGNVPAECLLNPTRRNTVLSPGSTIGVYGIQDRLAAALLSSILPEGMNLLLPETFSLTADRAREMECQVLTLCVPGAPLQGCLAGRSIVDMMLVGGPSVENMSGEDRKLFCRELVRVQCHLLVVVQTGSDIRQGSLVPALAAAAAEAGVRLLHIRCHGEFTSWPDLELGDLFAREICCGETTPVDWYPSGEVELLSQNLLDDADASPRVFPDRHPAGRISAKYISTCSQYSSAAQPSLRGAGFTDSGDRRIPETFLLSSGLDSAMMLMPWLEPIGFTDVHFRDPLGVRDGQVRETEILTAVGPWLRHDLSMVRMCHFSLSARDLTGNGRMKNGRTVYSYGKVIMGAPVSIIPPLWGDETAGVSGEPQDWESWYARRGIGAPWHLLSHVQILPGHVLTADLGASPAIALGGVWNYSNQLSAVEAILQGARMAFDFDPPEVGGPYCLSMIGFIRYGGAACHGPWRISLKRLWDAAGVVRYDAQAVSAAGQCFVSVNHLEFDSLPPLAGDKADRS